MLIDYENLESPSIYKLISQTVIPRPIAWIVTEHAGIVNIAPFSYFTPLSSTPPAVVVSIGHKADGEPKDTLHNITTTKKAVICFVDEKSLEKMHFSSKPLPKKSSEAKEFDIKTKKIYDDFPPMIQGVQSAFFCEFNQTIDLGGPTIPVVLNIKHQFVDDVSVKDEQRLTIDINNIARVGRSYAKLGESLDTPIIP
ncbi:MAG: flavin reductase family protein [Campylobacterota bacterium]|nr:flavin reductase family protein [Campylobacterota bacterium]